MSPSCSIATRAFRRGLRTDPMPTGSQTPPETQKGPAEAGPTVRREGGWREKRVLDALRAERGARQQGAAALAGLRLGRREQEVERGDGSGVGGSVGDQVDSHGHSIPEDLRFCQTITCKYSVTSGLCRGNPSIYAVLRLVVRARSPTHPSPTDPGPCPEPTVEASAALAFPAPWGPGSRRHEHGSPTRLIAWWLFGVPLLSDPPR